LTRSADLLSRTIHAAIEDMMTKKTTTDRAFQLSLSGHRAPVD
jgi:hypothetical protein